MSATKSVKPASVHSRILVPGHYHRQPVISRLVSRYGLTVNITSAILQPDSQDDGWFDLDLWGRTKQLYSSLSYLEKLGLPIWLDLSSVYGDR